MKKRKCKKKRVNKRKTKIIMGGHLLMITIETIYYFVAITGIMCGAAYKLGYENGKNARK